MRNGFQRSGFVVGHPASIEFYLRADNQPGKTIPANLQLFVNWECTLQGEQPPTGEKA